MLAMAPMALAQDHAGGGIGKGLGAGIGAGIGQPRDQRRFAADHDEVDDGAEAEAGTDPDAADTDFDGASDGAEAEAGTDPRVSSITVTGARRRDSS